MSSLDELIANGEGQAVEFKSQFPAQVRDLTKEIAALATSNDGVILIGVSDDGATTGLSDALRPRRARRPHAVLSRTRRERMF